jgi:hypothetical protein
MTKACARVSIYQMQETTRMTHYAQNSRKLLGNLASEKKHRKTKQKTKDNNKAKGLRRTYWKQ